MGTEVNKSNTRRFTWDSPVIWNGNLYPTGIYPIMDNQGNTRNRTVFVDEGNQYHTINDEGREVPMALAYQLPEVTVTGHRPMKSAESHANDLLTLSNDMTQVNNFPHRRYNPNLDYQTQQGAKSNAAWREEHPNASAWGDALGAVPFAVAAYPFVAGAGEYATGTALGQSITNGLNLVANVPRVKAALPWIDAALTSYTGAEGMEDINNGRFTPETAMDLMPLVQMAKPIAKDVHNLENGFREVMGSVMNSNFSLSNYSKGNKFFKKRLQGESPMPFDLKKERAKRYSAFIKSDEYADRLANAGFENYRDYIMDLTDKQIGNINYFPSSMATIIEGKPKIYGVTYPYQPPYNKVTIRKWLSPQGFTSTLDHEISHYATKGENVNDITPIGDIMKYNETIVPNIDWSDKLSLYPKTTPIDKIKEDYKRYTYLTDPQEKRARAYSLMQQAKDEGLPIDAFVDKFTKDGHITEDAPDQLQDMGDILTVENIKKYLNNFLSIGMPFGISTLYLNNKSNHYGQSR